MQKKIFERKKNKKGPKAFFLFVIVITLIFIYLLFFYTGLELIQEINTEGNRELALYNNSSLIVENITVFAQLISGKQLIQQIPKLTPGEKKTINLTTIEQPIITLIIEAPFQNKITKQVDLRAFKQININSKITAPKVIILNSKLGVSLELCNAGSTIEDIAIEEKHTPGFFSEQETVQLIDLIAGNCETLEYSFTPTQKGKTTILFNIRVLNNVKTLSQEIEVK